MVAAVDVVAEVVGEAAAKGKGKAVAVAMVAVEEVVQLAPAPAVEAAATVAIVATAAKVASPVAAERGRVVEKVAAKATVASQHKRNLQALPTAHHLIQTYFQCRAHSRLLPKPVAAYAFFCVHLVPGKNKKKREKKNIFS